MSGLIEYNCILLPFDLLQYVILVEVDDRNVTSYKFAVEKGDILIACSDNCGYSSLILH